ncbi:hypothetical protein P168DRAFT_332709 [Aspergillus campestris IBT 28561]|uniref:Uncharacterized protein n=1 Tax=Aspergillus campestris (strain IBT 28561) TaxID=1392248 RepID=A0A2I1DGW4_ASPC2|nr:uncharacterized protein P168DRAFT_332709 [Aspergillus campestris IBT 28561]PKY09114.1 hypothetical protein P168DRAFT_332709 [Aspergillus campestris IBT 28561]
MAPIRPVLCQVLFEYQAVSISSRNKEEFAPKHSTPQHTNSLTYQKLVRSFKGANMCVYDIPAGLFREAFSAFFINADFSVDIPLLEDLTMVYGLLDHYSL